MFSLMSFFLVVNLAVMMQELTGSQPMSAACASGAYVKISPKMVNSRDIAGNTEKEENHSLFVARRTSLLQC